MRIDAETARVIRLATEEVVGPGAHIRLFGSRVDDQARGGDIDLLVELDVPVERPALLSARLSARLSRLLGGRRVDVVLAAPNLLTLPIHEAARRDGVPL